MNIKLVDFQLDAIKRLLEAMESDKRIIILKSPTGSGKTIMLTHFMHDYCMGHSKTVFVWLTPGKGNLEEQSKEKMDKYIHGSQTKLLSDVMVSGFEENDACFINWEKLTKRGNTALRDSESTNFLEWIDKAHDNGLDFKIIIDESHENFTERADAVVQLFSTDKIIRCSATPIPDPQACMIEVAEADVISEGLIKKMLYINENFPATITTTNQTQYLLEKALNKQQQLHAAFLNKGASINPLIIVQLPNNSDSLLTEVESFFNSRGINTEIENLAVWLANDHRNIDNISKNDAPQIAVIMKQAVATGWDCPRAYILVKLRENMDETFEVQTIGRIRRMPEVKHYGEDLLDTCYLYTFDSKFTQGVKANLGKGALNEMTLFLKNEYKNIHLIKEQRAMVTDLRDSRKALAAIAQYMRKEYHLTDSFTKNKEKLAANGFNFANGIVHKTISGNISVLKDLTETDNFSVVQIQEPINTTIHGHQHQKCIGIIGLEIGQRHNQINTIIRKLFCADTTYSNKVLNLSVRELYAFVINNVDLLRHVVREAMSAELDQQVISNNSVSEKEFAIPHTLSFTFDNSTKNQNVSIKNVYEGYLMSAEPRSSSEKKFEKYCEGCAAIDWIYKNGDKGDEYLSIVYQDNSNRQKLFYPDYILSVNGEVWIVETKGGFTRTGESEDIDRFSPKKFEVLQNYLNKNNLKGGFVRYDKHSEELCLCVERYSDDINSDAWQVLDWH